MDNKATMYNNITNQCNALWGEPELYHGYICMGYATIPLPISIGRSDGEQCQGELNDIKMGEIMSPIIPLEGLWQVNNMATVAILTLGEMVESHDRPNSFHLCFNHDMVMGLRRVDR